MTTTGKNNWLSEVKAKFKKGDRVIAEIYFGDYLNTQTKVGRVDGIYRDLILIDFGGKYKRSFRWHDVYNGAVKPYGGRKGNDGTV